MPRKQKPGPLVTKDLEWLHKNDHTDTEDSPRKASVDAAGDSTMDSVTSKRARDPGPEPGVGKVPKKEGMQDVSGTESAQLRVGASGAAATASGASNANGTGETQVDMNVRRELGIFTETRTAVLPIRFACSFNTVTQSGSPNVLKIRMNAPYNILGDTSFVLNTEGSGTVQGISTHQALAYTGTNGDPFLAFETTLLPATEPTATTSGSGVVADTSCRPAWRAWYEKMYESYHTIETQYRITFFSPETAVGRRAVVYVDKDVYTSSSVGNVIPVDGNQYYLNSLWKGVEKHIISERIAGQDADKWVKQISGTWRPGVWNKNTQNEEEIKAWYATAAAPSPVWVENLVLQVRNDDFNTEKTNLNCLVELRYVVQFKDLKLAFRYPQATGSAVTFTTPANPAGATAAQQVTAAGQILQTPFAPFDWGSTV